MGTLLGDVCAGSGLLLCPDHPTPITTSFSQRPRQVQLCCHQMILQRELRTWLDSPILLITTDQHSKADVLVLQRFDSRVLGISSSSSSLFNCRGIMHAKSVSTAASALTSGPCGRRLLNLPAAGCTLTCERWETWSALRNGRWKPSRPPGQRWRRGLEGAQASSIVAHGSRFQASFKLNTGMGVRATRKRLPPLPSRLPFWQLGPGRPSAGTTTSDRKPHNPSG